MSLEIEQRLLRRLAQLESRIADLELRQVVQWVRIAQTGASPPESLGQYQYQLHSMVAQNVGGWDFARAHPPIA